ncbi:MAG: MFS transporter, partial [Solirubrobacteraceae bacterium]
MSTIALSPPQSEAAITERASGRATWLGFAVVIAAAVMDLLDSTITQTAAPAIRRELGGSYADLEWISAAYTLAMSASLLLGSRLGDILGRREVLLSGIAGFSLASVLCALARSPETLIAARAIQGAVAAVMIPQGFGLIRELFGEDGERKALGVFGPVMGMAAVLGPLVGGGLVSLDVLGTGWRAIFAVNVPLGLGALLLGRRHLPHALPVSPNARPDVLSVALAALGEAAIVYPLIEGREDGWPAWAVVLLAVGVALLACFVRLQGRRARAGRTPLVVPSILRRRSYVAGLLLIVFFIGAMGGMMISLNVMYQLGLGLSPLGCALATAAIPVVAIFGSITSSLLLGRLGRTTMQIGSATMALGLSSFCLV